MSHARPEPKETLLRYQYTQQGEGGSYSGLSGVVFVQHVEGDLLGDATQQTG